MVRKGQSIPTGIDKLVKQKSEAGEGSLCHHKESLIYTHNLQIKKQRKGTQIDRFLVMLFEHLGTAMPEGIPRVFSL